MFILSIYHESDGFEGSQIAETRDGSIDQLRSYMVREKHLPADGNETEDEISAVIDDLADDQAIYIHYDISEVEF